MEKLGEKVYCSECKRETNHQIIYTHERSSNPFEDFSWHAEYHIVECLGCETIAFVEQYGDEDIWKYIDGKREWVDEFTVYPEKIKEDTDEKDFYELPKIQEKRFKHAPKDILSLYSQIIDSFNREHYILCTSGLRTLIEGICSDLNIKEGYLYDNKQNKLLDNEGNIRKHGSLRGRVFEIYDKGLILFKQALLLQRVVKIGNMAIHRMETPDYSTLIEIINIIERLIHDVYELEYHKLLQDDK